MKEFKYGKSVCYSGYRMDQRPGGVEPSYEETLEDLLILIKNFKYIRMYQVSEHAEITLKIIREHKLDLKVMLGVDLAGEENNPRCDWGGNYTPKQVQEHIKRNAENIQKAIVLANEYTDVVFAVSAGNEAVPVWNSDVVRPPKVLEYIKTLKQGITQPVTYCDGYDEWLSTLQDVAKEVDFISVHTYPAWQGYNIDEALKVATKDYTNVQKKYPNKICVITETGWPSKSDGKRMKKAVVGEEQQTRFYNEISKWSEETETLVFLFEAFDEPWKGGGHPDEPETNWGLFNVDRTPKKALK
ncbi:MAG: glycosyl hydrolase 53 family protein [Candidatus Izimaplasma sp.]|nr:glycosyl hydrolase 53 family protein [Candidatus Izimaplasma bacterium]